MPWEPSTQRNILLLQRRLLPGGAVELKLHPFFRRVDVEGTAWLSTLSDSLRENSQLIFHALEFVDVPQAPDASRDGDTILTTTDYYAKVGLTSMV